MVKIAFDPKIPFEFLTQLLTVFSRNAINNAALVFESALQKRGKILINMFRIFLPYFICQICSIKAWLEADLVSETKNLTDVFFHFDSGCRCQAEDRNISKSLLQQA